MAEDALDKPRVGDLARLAGVSASTVSKVINGRPGVSPATRSAIEELLVQNGYSHSLVSTKVSQTIELVVDYISNNGTMEILEGASKWALNEGLAVTVTQTDMGHRREECFRGIVDRNPLGVILQMSEVRDEECQKLAVRDIPLVSIDPVTLPQDGDMSISIDNWTGCFELTQYLIGLGHTKIAIITGPVNIPSAKARFGGYIAAMQGAGVEIPPEFVRHSDYLPERGYQAACELLDLQERPTAIIACNDLTAVNVYRAARERGITLGTQLSVAGFDNVYPSQYLMPSLTTVNQPFDQMAKKAVEMIVGVRKGESVDKRVVFPTHLVVRESTQAPSDQ